MVTIQARFIIQIAGKPQEKVLEALNVVEKNIGKDSRYKVVESEVVEPELDEETTLYSGFLDILISFKEAGSILEFIVDYTPSSVDIEEPREITFDANDLNGILNDMSAHILKHQAEIRNLRAHIHMNMKKQEESKKK